MQILERSGTRTTRAGSGTPYSKSQLYSFCDTCPYPSDSFIVFIFIVFIASYSLDVWCKTTANRSKPFSPSQLLFHFGLLLTLWTASPMEVLCEPRTTRENHRSRDPCLGRASTMRFFFLCHRASLTEFDTDKSPSRPELHDPGHAAIWLLLYLYFHTAENLCDDTDNLYALSCMS